MHPKKRREFPTPSTAQRLRLLTVNYRTKGRLSNARKKGRAIRLVLSRGSEELSPQATAIAARPLPRGEQQPSPSSYEGREQTQPGLCHVRPADGGSLPARSRPSSTIPTALPLQSGR